MEGNDIRKMIRKLGRFDTTNVDREFNLDRMVKMQDEAAERDRRNRKNRRHEYGGLLGIWKDEGEPDEFNESLPRIRQDPDCNSDDYLEQFGEFKIGYPLPNLRRVLLGMGHDIPRERLAWGQQVRTRRGRKIRDPVYAKRGRYDEPDEESQHGSATPSEYGDDDQGTFAVPTGRAPGAAKKAVPLGAPGVATGSVTSRDDD